MVAMCNTAPDVAPSTGSNPIPRAAGRRCISPPLAVILEPSTSVLNLSPSLAARSKGVMACKILRGSRQGYSSICIENPTGSGNLGDSSVDMGDVELKDGS